MKTYTRQELYDLVWSKPMRDAAKDLGLSDNGLRKHCLKAFVPLPPQGHWNKVHAGQKVKITPLTRRPPGISDSVQIGQWDYREHQRNLLEAEPLAPTFDEPIEAVRERVSRNLGVVLVSKTLSPPHAAFRRQIEDDERRSAQSTWHTPIFRSPVAKRRLRILQGLFYGLSRLDCSVTVQGQDTKDISVTVGNQHVRIDLNQLPARRRSADDKDPERLKFCILKSYHSEGERAVWTDSDELKLEEQLSAIATEIVVAGELQYREHLIWLYNESIRQREEMQKAEIRKRLEAEKAERERLAKLEADRLKRLTDSAENYRRAQSIRSFVASVVELGSKEGDADRVYRWKEWALSQADKIDPISNGRIWNDVSDSV